MAGIEKDRAQHQEKDGESEQSTKKPLNFSKEKVNRALEETKAVNSSLIKGEYRIMRVYSMATAGLQDRIFSQRPSDRGENEEKSRVVGFSLAHRVLRYAAHDSGMRLPPLSDDLIKDYEAYISEFPGELEKGFSRDYVGHEEVTNLVNNFSNDHSKEGAMMMFTLYGRLANPNREPILIPARPPARVARPRRRRCSGGSEQLAAR